MSEGDSDLLLEEFVQYLTTISIKSSSLLRQRYAEVFEALETARGPNNSESHEDRLAQILVDIQEGSQNYNEVDSEEESEDQSSDIDLMASDNEEDEEEEIEPENEEDRAFLDDEIQEQEDVSFYRRLNVEVDRERRQQLRQTRDQLEELQDIVGGSEDVSDHKVLSQLEEKLNAYIQELPVLGFNSGKYDLNASKEVLFPYVIKHQPIKFTVKRNNNHMCIKTDSLKFLDISNYLAPGFSYDQFLKAYECEQTKGFFPYQWLDCLDKLEETSLPPHAAFYSSLKNANITGEEYRYCQHIRRQLNNTGKRIGDRKLPVDRFNVESQTVYQFRGCYWHGHDCALNRGKEVNEKRNKPMTELLEETRDNTEHIRSKD